MRISFEGLHMGLCLLMSWIEEADQLHKIVKKVCESKFCMVRLEMHKEIAWQRDLKKKAKAATYVRYQYLKKSTTLKN